MKTFELTAFCDSKTKLLTSQSRMREFIRRNSVNKVSIWILNNYFEIKFKIEDLRFFVLIFCHNICIIHKILVLGEQKTTKVMNRASLSHN